MVSPSPSARLWSISSHLDKNRAREESPSARKSAKMSAKTQDPNQLPWDPNCTQFPLLDELPKLPNAPEGAAWVWGDDDQVWILISRLIAWVELTGWNSWGG